MRIHRKLAIPRPFPAVWRAICAATTASFLLHCPSVHAQEASLEGRLVADIRVVDESGKDISANLPAIPLQAGRPFDLAEERESLRKLYFTGDYSDIRATATTVSGGSRVDFIVRRNYYNNLVRVDGLKEPPSEPAALAALRLNLGDPFRESTLRPAIDRLV